MKIGITLLVLLLVISPRILAQDEKENIQGSIVKFFDGLSAIDPDKLKEYATADFILLEDGHVWNMDTLVNKISTRKNSNLKRVNSFQFIRTDQTGNVAWVSYNNTAEFTLNEKQQTVRWLESAVLRKESGKWKIQLLHSTSLKK